jgi:transposase InsO family protein
MSDGKPGTRRDRVKEALWRKRVDAQQSSGLAVRAYCRREGLSEAAFHWWHRELARRDGEAKAASGHATTRDCSRAVGGGRRGSRSKAGGASNPARSAFVELTGPPGVAAAFPEAGCAAPVVEVVLRCGRVLRVRDGFTAETVGRLVTLLEAGSC